MQIIIPAGKEIKALVGGYIFKGPRTIFARDWKLPETYTDGTPLQYLEAPDAPSKSNSDDRDTSSNVDHSKSGHQILRDNQAGSGFSFVRPDSGKNGGTEELHGELGETDRPRRRSRKSETGPTISELTTEPNPDEGLRQDILGDAP